MARKQWSSAIARTLPEPFRRLAAVVGGPSPARLLMSGWADARIQLCGRFVVVIDGARIEEALPGRRGRALFAFLVLNRGRAVLREELLTAGWGPDASADAGSALSVLLSK